MGDVIRFPTRTAAGGILCGSVQPTADGVGLVLQTTDGEEIELWLSPQNADDWAEELREGAADARAMANRAGGGDNA